MTGRRSGSGPFWDGASAIETTFVDDMEIGRPSYGGER